MDRTELIENNLNLVYSIARAMRTHLPAVVELEELVADGFVGLTLAAQKFDESYGNQFNTYAGWRVRGAMLDGMRARDVVHRRAKWDAEDPRLGAAVRLDQPIREAGDAPLHEIIADSAPAFEDKVENADLTEWLLGVLPPKLADILRWMYWEDCTLLDVGGYLGVSESRVSQMHHEALHRMRLALHEVGMSSAQVQQEIRGHSKKAKVLLPVTAKQVDAFLAELHDLWT